MDKSPLCSNAASPCSQQRTYSFISFNKTAPNKKQMNLFNINPVRLKLARLWKNFGLIALLLRDSRTPVLTKVLALLLALYIISPVDLVADIIPVAGLLDELVIIPVGLWLISKTVPETLWLEYQQRPQDTPLRFRKYLLAGTLGFLFLWAAMIATTVYFFVN